jgi:hypothetical protein
MFGPLPVASMAGKYQVSATTGMPTTAQVNRPE